MKHTIQDKIPLYIKDIILKFHISGYEAQIVGGPVRDLLLNKLPKDWDLNTNATPKQIQDLFPDSLYENDFGTVGIKIRTVSPETRSEEVEVVEVTTYRIESTYFDGRHPSIVNFDATLTEDLKRRDFTVNAIAYEPIKDILYFSSGQSVTIKDILKDNLKDIPQGLKDINDMIISAEGNPEERFSEDYLRMLRAIRFSSQLNFAIEQDTLLAIKGLSPNLKSVSRERVRDEFSKILMSDSAYTGIKFLEFTGLLNDIMPELLLGKDMKQTENHKYDVYEHLLLSMKHACDKKYPLDMRLTALLHDIAKPHTMRPNPQTGYNTFYGHEVVGAKISAQVLNRLKYPQDLVSRVTKLVRWHMFNSDPDQVTMSAVRRMIINVGRENIWDLMNLRYCDRIGSGRPVEEPHRLRRYFAMIEEALTQPTDLKMMKIDGNKIMEVTHETPGPRLGLLLNALFGEILEDPTKNTEKYLVSRVTEMISYDISVLKELAAKAKEEQEEVEQATKKQIRRKFKV